MKAHDLDGHEFDIDRAEAERIAGELARLDGKETNEAFLKRSIDNIEMLTGERPKTEDELKKLLYERIPNTSMKTIELLYEAMETITGWHSMKTKSM